VYGSYSDELIHAIIDRITLCLKKHPRHFRL